MDRYANTTIKALQSKYLSLEYSSGKLKSPYKQIEKAFEVKIRTA